MTQVSWMVNQDTRISWDGIPKIFDEQFQIVITERASRWRLRLAKWLLTCVARRVAPRLDSFYRVPDRIEVTLQWASALHGKEKILPEPGPEVAWVHQLSGHFPTLWKPGQRIAELVRLWDVATTRQGELRLEGGFRRAAEAEETAP